METLDLARLNLQGDVPVMRRNYGMPALLHSNMRNQSIRRIVFYWYVVIHCVVLYFQ